MLFKLVPDVYMRASFCSPLFQPICILVFISFYIISFVSIFFYSTAAVPKHETNNDQKKQKITRKNNTRTPNSSITLYRC